MNQPQLRSIEARSQQNPTKKYPCEGIRRSSQHQQPRPDHLASALCNTDALLDSTNNRLQELMQLLYLLSRDPAVPTDVRYHVTVAQSEIALLARLIQNSAEERGVKANPSAAAHPL